MTCKCWHRVPGLLCVNMSKIIIHLESGLISVDCNFPLHQCLRLILPTPVQTDSPVTYSNLDADHWSPGIKTCINNKPSVNNLPRKWGICSSTGLICELNSCHPSIMPWSKIAVSSLVMALGRLVTGLLDIAPASWNWFHNQETTFQVILSHRVTSAREWPSYNLPEFSPS